MTIEYSIGADPELFVINEFTREFISAHDIIPGSKAAPTPVMCGAVQPDGVAAEFNILPAKTEEEFTTNIRTVLMTLQDMVNAHNPHLQLYCTPTAMFNEAYFKTLPPLALALGCEPDMDVYLAMPRSASSLGIPMRTGGGHVHIGWTEHASTEDDSHLFDCSAAVMQLDAALYIPSLIFDMDDQRRKMYGKIGSYRSKHYGVEYRPLSNLWVSDPDLQAWVFNTTVQAMERLDDDEQLWREDNSAKLIDKIVNGQQPDPSEVIEHAYWLIDDLDLPALPDRYVSEYTAKKLGGA